MLSDVESSQKVLLLKHLFSAVAIINVDSVVLCGYASLYALVRFQKPSV